jgi:uncharacterized membrane protein
LYAVPIGTAVRRIAMNKANNSIVKMVELAVLTAIMLLVQLGGIVIPLPGTSLNLVLLIITLGGIMMGPWSGAFLGALSGFITYYQLGISGLDPMTAFMFQENPIVTGLICIGKTALAGLLTGVVFNLISKNFKGKDMLASFIASATTPIVNTGVFALGCLSILGTLDKFASSLESGAQTGIYFIFVTCIGINFTIELFINTILAPTLNKIKNLISKNK